MKEDVALERRIQLARLYDLYSPVLTEKQRRVYELHELADWSLSEISKELKISRQGVFDQLQRARERLEDLESQLGFCRRISHCENRLAEVGELVRRYDGELPPDFRAEVATILKSEEEK